MNDGCEPLATVGTVVEALRSKAVGAEELARECLRRIRADDGNSFVTVCEEQALAAARQADSSIAAEGFRDLRGVPLAHKDVFCTEDVATTCGSRMLGEFVSPYDAAVVERLKAAGAVMLGKTNMDEFAMGSSNETSWFGPVANPWDPSRVPGGSSGGSAAAVAAGLVPAATGTDTGGSIRQPAAFCGISGLKPTYGRVSRYGMVAFASSLDQGGPMARSAADLRLLLRFMEGHDARDSTSVAMPPTERGERRRLRIGLAAEYWQALGGGLAGVLREAAKTFEGGGHELRDVSLAHTDYAVPAYYVVASAEASTNLSRYDGVRYGHRAADAGSLDELYSRSRSEGFGAEVKRRILTGAYTLSVGYYDAYYRKAQRVRRLVRQDFLDAFEEVDLILAPTTPTTAFPRADGQAEDPTAMYRQDVFTVPASLAGLPALSIPCGFDAGLPAGLQLIAPHFGEGLLLDVAEAYQQETDWHLRSPEGRAQAGETAVSRGARGEPLA